MTTMMTKKVQEQCDLELTWSSPGANGGVWDNLYACISSGLGSIYTWCFMLCCPAIPKLKCEGVLSARFCSHLTMLTPQNTKSGKA